MTSEPGSTTSESSTPQPPDRGAPADPARPGDEVAAGGTGEKPEVGFLLRSAASLVSTAFLTSGLGFIYWAVSARLFSATVVGESSTAIAAMNLIAPFATLGLGTLLLVQLPGLRERRSELVVTASLLSGLVGGLLALVCAFVLPLQFFGLPGIGVELAATALFAAGVAAQSVGAVLDSALLSVEGGGPQLTRNVALAVAKLVLLVLFALVLTEHGSLSIYASWFVANVLSILLITAIVARRRGVSLRRLLPAPSTLRGLRLDAAQHHALNLALQVPYFAMPIIANATLGAEQAGYLYATWSVAGFVFVLPVAMATALFASGARDAAGFRHEFRMTLRYSTLACVAANVVLLPFGGLVLGIFGSDYADAGHATLVILCAAGLGLVIKDHHVTIARVTGRVGREAMLVWVLTALELIGATVGALLGGLTGLGLGWLAAVAVEAVVYGPLVWRVYRGRLRDGDMVAGSDAAPEPGETLAPGPA